MSEAEESSSPNLPPLSLKAAPPTSTLPSILTVDELAVLLRVNRKTAYDAIAEGRIPGARRVGRAIRVSRDAVLEWLHGQVREPRSSKR